MEENVVEVMPLGFAERNRRRAFAGLGIVFIGLGYVGMLLPVMPSTVFFILALWAFKKSSPRLEAWILNNRIVGPVLRDWDRDKSMSIRAKITAIAMIWVAICSSAWMTFQRGMPIVAAGLIVTAITLTMYLKSVKTKVD